MEDIKFCGRDNFGEWHFGGITQDKKFIVDKFTFQSVNPETVSQFTNNYDCDGKEIFEGDILKNMDCDEQPLQVVFWNKDYWAVIDVDDYDDIVDEDSFGLAWTLDHGNFKIVGNIYDNPPKPKKKKVN